MSPALAAARNPGARAVLAPAALLTALVGATLGLQRAGERTLAAGAERVAALPAVPFLEVLALGWRTAAADLAWLQAVQYYGEYRQGGNDLSEFQHYLLAVNTLDPRFEHAYIFGAVVLATEGHDLPAALAVLKRGARANPDSPLCSFEMGFLSYVVGQDTDAALRWLALSGRKPGGAERALRFRAYLNRRLGRLETAWMLWNDVHRTTRDPGMRLVAAENLRRIEADLRARSEPRPRP
jgi:hypothetical protein